MPVKKNPETPAAPLQYYFQWSNKDHDQ